MADGPVIQAASVAALKGGMTLVKVREIVQEIRRFSEMPLVGMGYVNNMLHYGFPRFVEDFKAAGMNGVIISEPGLSPSPAQTAGSGHWPIIFFTIHIAQKHI